MTSYYDKILNNKKDTNQKPRHSKRLISLDDSIGEQQQPNIFSDSKVQNEQKVTEPKKVIQVQKQSPTKIMLSDRKLQPIAKKQNSSQIPQKVVRKQVLQTKKQARIQRKKIQIIEDDYPEHNSNEDNEVHGVSKKSWLSLGQSFSLSLGHMFYTYNFPIRRQIPIIANNLDLQREKYQNGTYISESFDNNLQVSFFLFFLKTIILQNFLRLSTLLWIIAIILSFIISNNTQYRPGKQILLGIFIFYCVFSIILQYLSLKNRREWSEPSSNVKYRVYHYDNQLRTAEWIPTQVKDLRPGNIYKVPASIPGKTSVIPADSILLHGPRTIVQVDQSPIIEYLSPMQKQQSISLKQTVLKSDVVMLPLTGVVHYELAAPEIIQDNVTGKFMLQEPTEETYAISYNNVVLRGTKLFSTDILLGDQIQRENQQSQSLLAIVLQTGIDSLVLKMSQYPYQYRKNYVYCRIIDLVMIVCSICYLLVVGAGILIGYIYIQGQSITKGYYINDYLNLGEVPVKLSQVILHHFSNFIMIIPILLRISYLLFINLAGRRIGGKVNLQLKDMNMIAEPADTEIFVTTIGSDLVKMGGSLYQQDHDQANQKQFGSIQQGRLNIRNRSLQSIRVGGIHHNFITTRIDNDMYTTKDVDMICYFMSIALLTCNRKNPTPLERGIIERCNKQLKVSVEKSGKVIKIGQLRVVKIFSIPATQKYPFKILFFKHGKDIVQDLQNPKIENKQKVLCLIRGQTTKLAPAISEGDGKILKQFSSKLHQEKGLHIQLLGKFVLSFQQFVQVRRAYMGQREKDSQSKIFNANQSRASSIFKGNKYGIQRFYQGIQKYLTKIDPMGLLIWQNPYSVLNSNLLPISSLNQPQYKIIIAPPSKSQINPEFESIHAITNYLLKASKLSLKQISSKILHHYSDKETFWALLKSQKIIVLNGWDYRVIKKMLSQLKQVQRKNKKSLKMLGYIEQDQYAWVLKQTDVSIATKGDGHDLQKYADILIDQNNSDTTTQVIRKIIIYSAAYSYCLSGIVVIQFSKSIILATIQFIYNFYTWGTGLVLIGSPLYLVLEIGILLDFLYYIFPILNDNLKAVDKQEKRAERNKKDKQPEARNENTNYLSLQFMIVELISSIAVGCFLCFIPIYSLTQPSTPSATLQPKQFTHVLIHFLVYHCLVFRKIFLRPYSLSAFKVLILAIQIGVYYLGLLIVSAVDYYQYRGMIWFVLQGRIILVGIFCTWIVVGVYWLSFVISTIMKYKLKVKSNNYQRVQDMPKKEDQISDNKDLKIGEPVDID